MFLPSLTMLAALAMAGAILLTLVTGRINWRYGAGVLGGGLLLILGETFGWAGVLPAIGGLGLVARGLSGERDRSMS